MNNVGEKYDGNTVPSTLLYGHHLGMENLAVKEGWLLVRMVIYSLGELPVLF